MIGLFASSLFRQIAACLFSRSSVSLIGGIDASISKACMGEVQNAVQISLRAQRWVFLSHFSCVFLPVHHTGLA